MIVWGGAYFINKLFEKQIENVKNKSLVNFYEKIYTNNISSLRKTKALEFAFEFVCLLYIVTLLVSFINLDFKGFIEYGIFGLFSIFSGYKTYKLFTKLLLLLKNKSLNEDVICEFLEESELDAYNHYSITRNECDYVDMLQKNNNKSDKKYKIFSAFISCVCILLGFLLIVSWLPMLFFATRGEIFIIAMVLYANMACYYGIKDLIDIFK